MFTRLAIFIILLFSGYASRARQNVIPGRYEAISEVSGDLDNDGIPEKVVVYDRNDSAADIDAPFPREIIIYKKNKTGWIIWHRSTRVFGSSRIGFVDQNPYFELSIDNGVLILMHAGGTRWKWSETAKYRYQSNAFELIGFTYDYGTICEYWLKADFNFPTGRVNVTKEYEKCENQTQVVYKRENESFTYKFPQKITLANWGEVEVRITSPKYKHELSF